MKKIVLCVILLSITTATLIGFDKETLYWNLQELYTDPVYSDEGLKQAENYNPDNDSVFLPLLINKNLFESIDDLSICRRSEVRKFLYIYLTKGRPFTKKAISNSYLYIDIILNEFNEFPDFPEEIAYLPLLESSFNPFAVSRTGAVGLWQFVRSTSKIIGLKRNKWIDERRDVRKSTKAAIKHLMNIYPLFNSWDLTLAAYNGGAGHVKRAMLKANKNNIWELRQTGILRKECSDFVPRFAALLLIYKNRRLFGLDNEIQNTKETRYDFVTLQRPFKLCQLSKLSGVPIKTIRSINPELKRNAIPPYLQEYDLLLPVNTLSKIDDTSDKPPIIRYIRL